jgi:hypothetical protein
MHHKESHETKIVAPLVGGAGATFTEDCFRTTNFDKILVRSLRTLMAHESFAYSTSKTQSATNAGG